MAAITNTYTTSATKGIREDLSNIISNISPTETPFTSNAGTRARAKQTFYEWQLDSLAAADNANAQVEGDDITAFPVIAATTRVGNYQQISRKLLILSDTDEVVDKAGRNSELAYQISKRGKELKIDKESICLSRNTGALNTDPRRTATMLSYVRTNVDLGATGVNPAAPAPSYAGNRTDGTQRAFTEVILKNIIALGYTSGMKIDGSVLLLGPAQKGVFSTFAGIATKFKDVKSGQATIIGASDVYVSDFGEISVAPDRFQRNRDAWLVDFDLVGFKELRPYKVVDLAKTGDATKKMLLNEWSLQVDNEAGLALAADLI
jgi:hypothetical protein